MPNQRKKGKAIVSTWVGEKDHQHIKKLATAHGVTMSDIVKVLIEELKTMDKKVLNQIVEKAKGE